MKLISQSSSSSLLRAAGRVLPGASLALALCVMGGSARAHDRADRSELKVERHHHTCQSHRQANQEARLAQRLETVHAAVVHAARRLEGVQTAASTEELYEARARLSHARTHLDNRAWRAAHRALDRAELLANRIAYTARKARRARARARKQKAKGRFKVALQHLDREIDRARWHSNLVTYQRSSRRALVVARRARAEALRLAKEGRLRPATAKLKSAKRALKQWRQVRRDRRAGARPDGRHWTARG